MMRPTKEEARQKVLQSFPIEPPPQRLFIADSEKSVAAAQALGNSDWNKVSAEALKSPWYSLTAEGWRYYLPARLLHALDTAEQAWPFSIAMVPHMDAVLFGRDLRLDERLEGLSGAQYEAATQTLWALMDTTSVWGGNISALTGRWCAKALYYGWNKRPSGALDAARAYYAGLDNHSYSAHADPAIEALLGRLREAFADAPYPGDDRICNDPGHCSECAGYHVELRGRHWRTMHPDVIKVNDSAPCFLSPAGFRFFLPAWIIADLHGDGWNTDPVFHLTYDLDDERQDRSLDKLQAFSPRERSALAEYLHHRRSKDEFSREAIDRALERFWERPA